METKFERGGTLPIKRSKQTKTAIFGSRNAEREKSTKQKTSKRDHDKKSKKDSDKDDNGFEIRSARSLNFRSLISDMIVMGIVKSIHQTHILLNLPGRLVGRVPATKISEAYTNAIKSALEEENDDDNTENPKSLTEMFKIGQVVYTKVLEKCHGEKQEILLSLLPKDINSEIIESMLAEGNVILCAIKEIEDHGYFLETGIDNVRCFLPKKPNSKFEQKIGELIFCKVQKISSNIITFTSFKKNEHVKIDTLDVPNVKTILPGTIVNFTVVQILKDGLEGLLFDGSITAYVNEMHIPSKLSTDTNLIGKEVKARVLYTMPLSNQLLVTLYIDEQSMEDKSLLPYGTIIEKAKVIKQINGGVLFKLNAKDKAFLPRKTIIKSFKGNFDIDSAMNKFSPNTMHTIRIMDYNNFDNCYLSTNIEKMLKEKFYGTYDLDIGQIVKGKVEEILKDGTIRMSVGNVKAFLRGVFYHKQSNIAEGSEIRVRVAEIDHHTKTIQVTNQPGFLRDGCKILDSTTKLKKNECFTGVVLNSGMRSYTVLFFNHIKGILPKSPANETDLLSIGGELKDGSVKLFEIVNVKGTKVILGIPKKINTENIGKIFDCKVTAILPANGLQIFINELKSYGRIPINYLSEFPSLNEHILSAIKENSKFEVVSMGNSIFSRRDVKYFKNQVVLDFNEVKPNDILRCSVKSVDESNIELECALKNFNETIRLNKNAFDDPDNLILSTGDIVYVNTIAKNESANSNSLYVTPSFHKVWKNEDEALNMLENYLDDISFLMESLRKLEKPFGKYTIGQRISGKIKNIIGNNLLIEVEENVYAQGSVDNVHTCKVDGQVKDAVIVWLDPLHQMLYVTTRDKCKDEVSIDQEIDESAVCEKKHKSSIVYYNDYVTVCTARKPGPLIYTPAKNHYNDFSPVNERAIGNAKSKLVIKRSYNGKLLGIFVHNHKVFQKLEKLKAKLDQKVIKRKQVNSISEADEDLNENKRPKVVLETDSDDENETSKIDHKDEHVKTLQKKQKMMKVAKAIKNVVKNPLQISKRKAFFNKESLLDNNTVNLTSYKEVKEGNHQSKTIGKKTLMKSTIGSRKKVKRLIKKK